MAESEKETESRDSGKPEEDLQRGTLHYAFIYCTIFLLVFLVALQFEPLVGYRYPVLLLVAAVILLFIGTTIQESKQDRVTQEKKQSLSFTLIIIIAACLVLILLIIPESPVLFLLIPLTLGILFMVWFREKCRFHRDST